MYAVASYFSLQARQAAASERYVSPVAMAAGIFGRTKAGCCPVGVLLRADGYGMKYTQPDSAYAATAIYDRESPAGKTLSRADATAHYREIRTATAAFITAWDEGEIHDLAEALGVAKTPSVLLGNSLLGPRKAAKRVVVGP